jgi:hypothetical protein
MCEGVESVGAREVLRSIIHLWERRLFSADQAARATLMVSILNEAPVRSVWFLILVCG